ncbi:MAG TPA: hypothetical protein VJ840_16330 [Gemmatimonadaceae bacterium]|nr:hypothetical protein [Gemmatimonadaceae bacterium]
MPWYVYVAHFFGAAFFANSLPHLIAGVARRRLQTPFASPPFKGLSSPIVNVAWGLVNLSVAYLLLIRLGPVDFGNLADVVVCFVGFAAMAAQCARAFGSLRKTAT